MRILFLNWKDPSDPRAGGAEVYIKRISEIWATAGHQVEVFVPATGPGAADQVREGVRYIRRGRARTTVFPLARRFLSRAGDQYDHVIDSVSTRPFFTHEIVPSRATSIYHQLADDVWPQEFPFPVSWLGRHVFEPRWLRRMVGARIVSDSRSTADDLVKHGLESVAIVHPGTDPPPLTADRPESGGPRLGFVGRMVGTKRPGDALKAFNLIRQQHPGATLDVIGDGYLLPELSSPATAGVTFHGAVSEHRKHELLAGLDLVLLPGTREGWGLVATEAGWHGTPVVAYDIPGLRDSVVDGVNGILTAAEPARLATASLGLLADPARWAQLSSGGRARSREHTWERTAGHLMAVLASR